MPLFALFAGRFGLPEVILFAVILIVVLLAGVGDRGDR
jgi:hypothetical protein